MFKFKEVNKMSIKTMEWEVLEDLPVHNIIISVTDKTDLELDFTTSSAISRVNIKVLAIYLPIFWLSGMLVGIYLYEHMRIVNSIEGDLGRLIYIILML